MSGFEIVMSVLTAIYVGATVIYVRISKNTLHAIRKQGEENLKQFNEQIPELRKSANAARDSAEAALRSAKLQEMLNAQWVDFEKWEVTGQSAPDVDAAINKTRRSIHFACEIVNRSSMPLTVVRFELTALDRVYTAAFKSFLIPQTSVPQSFVVIVTSREQIEDFMRNRLTFDFHGVITFIDSSSQECKQPFAFHCRCGMSGGQIDVLRERQEAT